MSNWIKKLFTLKPIEPVEIWKDVKLEYLRETIRDKDEGFWFDHRENGGNFDGRDWIPNFVPHKYFVYALYQKSITTGSERILERLSEEKMKEFDISEETRQRFVSSNSNHE